MLHQQQRVPASAGRSATRRHGAAMGAWSSASVRAAAAAQQCAFRSLASVPRSAARRRMAAAATTAPHSGGPEMMMQHADPLPCCCSIANVVLTATVDVCAVEQLVLQPIKTISGTVKLPGSKSLSNRILLLAALAEGTTVVKNLLVRSCVCALGGWSQRQLYMTLSIDAAFR